MLQPIEKPIAAILALFYSWIPNYGVAIILLSVVWMILMAPLTVKQTRSMLAMQKLQPELKKLQERHKNDRMALNQAMQGLYKEHGVSPLGGCLPMLLPFPLLIALFEVVDGLSKLTHGKPTPKFLAHNTLMYHEIVKAHGALNAFGMDLAKSAVGSHGTFLEALPYFALILIMMGSQYYQQAQMTSRNPAASQNPQMKMMKYLPIVFGIIYIRFPAGVVLYYTVSNLCRVTQQWAMYRYDPKVKQLVTQEVVEVEAKTRDLDNKEGAPAARPKLRELISGAAQQAAEQAEANRRAKAAGGKRPSATPSGNAKGSSSGRGTAERRAGPAANKGGPAKAGAPKGSSARPTSGKRPTPATAKGALPAGAKGAARARTGKASSNGSGAMPQKAGASPPRQPSVKQSPPVQPTATTNGGDSTNGNGQSVPVPAASRPQGGARTGAGKTGAGSSSKSSRKRRGR